MKDVIPLSLGLEIVGGFISVILPRNTKYPVSITQNYTTENDNQTNVIIEVFEGEGKLSKECNKLGKFDVHGIPRAPACTVIIHVIFSYDANGILTVDAHEESSGTKGSIKIENKKGRLSEKQI